MSSMHLLPRVKASTLRPGIYRSQERSRGPRPLAQTREGALAQCFYPLWCRYKAEGAEIRASGGEVSEDEAEAYRVYTVFARVLALCLTLGLGFA